MITMNDIAARAGVSQATVSYVLNDRKSGVRISDETRSRVMEAVSELGYHRNELARAMVTGKNRVLGFIANSDAEGLEFKARVLSGIQEEANARGYLVKVFYLPLLSGEAAEEEVVRLCMGWRVTALATVSLSISLLERLHVEMARHDVPMGIVEDPTASAWETRIASDETQAFGLIFDHLLALGHRRIACLSGTAHNPLAEIRTDIYRQLMSKAGLPVADNWVEFGDWWQPAANDAATRRLLTGSSAASRPTAIVCLGDPIAVVAMRTARALGFDMPRELSVTGFGNYTFAELSDPPLTTIAQPFEEIGRRLTQRLLTRVESEASAQPPRQIPLELLATRLVVRASTSPPNE